MKRIRTNLKMIAAFLWLGFALSMVGWWWWNGVTELKRFSAVDDESIRKIRMLTWEGAFFFGAIVVGGLALLVLIYRDKIRIEQMRLFFSNFNHDLKTSITRIRLQTELIEEDLKGAESLSRLKEDINRLNLQLENSLLLSTHFGSNLLLEEFKLSEIIRTLRSECPEIEIKLKNEVSIKGDRRVISSLFRNLIYNSLLHGRAQSISLTPKTIAANKIEIQFMDDGVGYAGSQEQLATLGRSLQSQSGRRGFGLFVSRNLLNKMNGDITFTRPEKGFCAHVLVEGRLS